ncbi:hypothetical protein PHMEG_00016970 [Phytophthora megakarya]|uniref:Uncharacterized protein n=1 Tax=Phytophthora megakarya TaxID=4795 RepID=A0A225VXN8_9STRA|nr:hypothetical protein PHMEG_00016970 [Phytophthora megakarya]
MAAIASRLFPPGRTNPPTGTICKFCRDTVRIKCPHELDREWDRPVYATLGLGPIHKCRAADTPFLDRDDGVRRPACQATLTILPHDQRFQYLPAQQRDYVAAERFSRTPHRDLMDERFSRTGG